VFQDSSIYWVSIAGVISDFSMSVKVIEPSKKTKARKKRLHFPKGLPSQWGRYGG
jgi:hypothetical protein